MALLKPLRRWRVKWRSQRNWSFRDSLLREAGSGLLGQLYLDRGGGPEDAVFLAGTARSGTSWLSEVVNCDNDFRMIHEPMRRDRLRVTSVFRPRHYLRPDDRDPALVAAMETVLCGRIRSVWTDKYNRKPFPRKRLVREVRANLLLPWIRSAFGDMPMILLLRHPCAVAASQMKWGAEWSIDLSRFLAERDLVDDLLAPIAEEIRRTTDPFEQHVMAWCIENVVPLSLLRRGEIHVALYEHLVTWPEDSLERLFGFLHAPVPDAALARVARASRSTRRDSAIAVGADLVTAWQKDVTEDRRRRTAEILALFGLGHVYGEEPMPRLADPAEALAPD